MCPSVVNFCLIYLFHFFAQLNLYLQQFFIRYTRTICPTRYIAQFEFFSYFPYPNFPLLFSPSHRKSACAWGVWGESKRVKFQFLFVTFEKFIWFLFICNHGHHSFYSFHSPGDELFAMQTISTSILYLSSAIQHKIYCINNIYKIFSHWFHFVFYTAKKANYN